MNMISISILWLVRTNTRNVSTSLPSASERLSGSIVCSGTLMSRQIRTGDHSGVRNESHTEIAFNPIAVLNNPITRNPGPRISSKQKRVEGGREWRRTKGCLGCLGWRGIGWGCIGNSYGKPTFDLFSSPFDHPPYFHRESRSRPCCQNCHHLPLSPFNTPRLVI